jgi:signal transduction histidine kinase
LLPKETYKVIVKEAVNLVKGKEGKIVMMKNRVLTGVYSSEDPPNLTVRKNGYTYKCFRSRKAFVVHEEAFKDNHPGDLNKGFKSVIFIPLHYKKKSFGVLLIKSKEFQIFTDKELTILKLFGAIASLTLRKTELLNATEKNLEMKDRFIALAAHELRTPLTSMSGFIQLLHRKLRDKVGVESEWTETLLQESNRLKVLIEEILDINKINAGKLQYNYEECEVKEIIEAARRELHQTYPQRSVRINERDHDNKVVGDRQKLTKSFYNILENSAKFSNSDSDIEVNLQKNESYSIITFKDSGRGIKKEDFPYIFEGFFKGRGNEQEGMGLGLFFTKNIIHGHKGTIKITSREDKGTSVEIRLPLMEQL